LTAENNQVHRDLIRIADERDARERRAQTIIRKNEAEISDLKFMAAQCNAKLATERQKLNDERKRVEDLVSKMGGVGGTDGRNGQKGSKGNQLFNTLQKIDLETGLGKYCFSIREAGRQFQVTTFTEPQRPVGPDFPPPSPLVIDAVAVAQSRVDALQKVCDDLTSKNGDLENEVLR
jgi:hypothetical protein